MQIEKSTFIQNDDAANFNLLKKNLVDSHGRFELFSFYAADETDRPRKHFRFNNLEKMMKFIEENELLTGETLYIWPPVKEAAMSRHIARLYSLSELFL